MKPHRATLILVLGILTLLFCQILGFVPWLMGNRDLKEMAAGTMDPAGRDLTNVGRILGIVAIALCALSIIAGLIILVTAGAAAAASQ